MYVVGDWVEGNVGNLSFGDWSLRFEKQEITISLRIFFKKWFGTCMICPFDSSKKNGAPGNFLVPLAIFRAKRDSSSLRTIPILDDDVIIMCPSDLIG